MDVFEKAKSLIGRGGAADVDVRGTTVTFIVPVDATDVVYARALIGSTDGCDVAEFERAALEANFFWQGAHGATLSVQGSDVFLTDRRPAVFFDEDEGGWEAYAETFADQILLWRERLEAHRLPAEKEVL